MKEAVQAVIDGKKIDQTKVKEIIRLIVKIDKSCTCAEEILELK